LPNQAEDFEVKDGAELLIGAANKYVISPSDWLMEMLANKSGTASSRQIEPAA